VVAIQEELNNFKRNQMWTLVERPNQNIVGTKRVFHNKQDEFGIVTRNKAKLMAKSFHKSKVWILKKPFDEWLVPDLSRDRGRSIGADLDVGQEGSEQTIVILQSLHHGSIGYQHLRT
jgi:hypothetical protein